MARTPAPGTRDRILDTAARLFYDNGVRAVGMQQIVSETGIGKNLLYREFESKDELVVAYLERLRGDWAALVAEHVEPLADDPAAQLVALTRLAAAQVSEDGYRGCAFRNCYSEFPDPDNPAGRVAGAHLQGMRRQVLAIARRIPVADPQQLGERVWLVVEGIYAASAHPGGRKAAANGIAMVEDLIADRLRA